MSKFLRYVGWTLLIAGIVIGLARLTVIRWWRVPLGDPYLEASLAPTLRGGDWVILWRGSAPSVGSLALCPEPKAAGRYVVARILAGMGDHVKVSSGGVLINDRKFETEAGCDPFKVKDPGSGQEAEQGCRLELIGSRKHPRGELNAALPPPSDAEVEVTGEHVFLVSDNRQFPFDSRDFGPVERSTCAESVIFRLVSKDGFFDVPNRLTLIR